MEKPIRLTETEKEIDQEAKRTKALEFFKDWSNYLLVTTVAALGWVATAQQLTIYSNTLRILCVTSLALSISFGILTLAIIPMIQEERKDSASNYSVRAAFWFLGLRQPKLTVFCFPQHILFIYAVSVFALGTLWRGNHYRWVAEWIGIVLGILSILLIIGRWIHDNPKHVSLSSLASNGG